MTEQAVGIRTERPRPTRIEWGQGFMPYQQGIEDKNPDNPKYNFQPPHYRGTESFSLDDYGIIDFEIIPVPGEGKYTPRATVVNSQKITRKARLVLQIGAKQYTADEQPYEGLDKDEDPDAHREFREFKDDQGNLYRLKDVANDKAIGDAMGFRFEGA